MQSDGDDYLYSIRVLLVHVVAQILGRVLMKFLNLDSFTARAIRSQTKPVPYPRGRKPHTINLNYGLRSADGELRHTGIAGPPLPQIDM